jgi:ABC-2 type transport system ATP-binding protein
LAMIELENLTKNFGPIKAVDSLTLSVDEGLTVGFLGPNGAGKTTTIKILTDLISATSGRAMLQGINVLTDPKKALKNVGAVVETPEFYPYLTPIETLAYLGRIRGMHTKEIQDRTNEVIRQVKLEQWTTTRIGKFSKGMKQRLAIAQALLHEPDILILDEPTSGLDPRGMVEVREIIKELKKQKYTIFMSSHLLGEVQEVCDKAALIDHGKLLIYDTLEKLGTLIKVLSLEVTVLGEVGDSVLSNIRTFANVKEVVRATSNTFVVSLEGGPGERADLLQQIISTGVKVTGFTTVGVPLESLYMDLVKDSR